MASCSFPPSSIMLCLCTAPWHPCEGASSSSPVQPATRPHVLVAHWQPPRPPSNTHHHHRRKIQDDKVDTWDYWNLLEPRSVGREQSAASCQTFFEFTLFFDSVLHLPVNLFIYLFLPFLTRSRIHGRAWRHSDKQNKKTERQQHVFFLCDLLFNAHLYSEALQRPPPSVTGETSVVPWRVSEDTIVAVFPFVFILKESCHPRVKKQNKSKLKKREHVSCPTWCCCSPGEHDRFSRSVQVYKRDPWKNRSHLHYSTQWQLHLCDAATSHHAEVALC